MNIEKQRVASGVEEFDRLLGGLFIGDNVLWHDDAGSLASVFCLNFIKTSLAEKRPLVYVSFDRSPKNLLERLGGLAKGPLFTILDCFTFGKGAGSDVFLRFYEEGRGDTPPCSVVRVENPKDVSAFAEAFYRLHGTLEGCVCFVFESLTGMQEVWGGEEKLLAFYSHSCPRLYELNTIAYWVLEKRAHSTRLRAQINQIAQVAIELSARRGNTSLTLLKAESRDLAALNKPHAYWSRGLNVAFDREGRTEGIDVGLRLRQLRTKRGLSQTELARQAGVTPSTISQIESNMIYPSLPGFLKLTEVLGVDPGSFFQKDREGARRFLYPRKNALEVRLADTPGLRAWSLTPVDIAHRAEPYLVEIAANTRLPTHFLIHKGEELGYVLEGRLDVEMGKSLHTLSKGDVLYLTSQVPTLWSNPGPDHALLLWLKIA